MLINNAVLTGSFIVNGVNYITNTPSTGSNTFVGTQTISGSTLMTGSLGVTGSVSVSGSITATGTLTAQTLVVQTVTSSIVYSSGSNIFGNQLTDVQQMTGSLRVTGSGNHYILGGNVGIGTTNPATYSGYTTLAINNATNGAVLDFLSNGTRVASINNGGASFDIETKTALAIAFSTSGSERMRITASGSVGIGTVSPENILTLIKNTTAATENTYGLSIQSINNNAYTELLLGASDAVDAGIIQTAAKNTNFTAKSLSLQPQGGNVLIGTTTNASYKLDVSGSGRFSGALTVSYANPILLINGTAGSQDILQFGISGTPVFSTGYRAAVTSYVIASGSDLNTTPLLTIASTGAAAIAGGLAIGNATPQGSVFYLTSGVLSAGAGTYPLKWNSSSGIVTYDTSSRLVKENIEDNPYGLKEVLQLKPRKYYRIDDEKYEIGFVADEVLDIIPELVPLVKKSLFSKNEEDDELIAGGVYYDKLTSVLVKAIQELQAKLDKNNIN